MKALFEVEQVAEGIMRLTDITGVSAFLAEGEQEAVLIDTGVGIGDLRGLAESLTKKPIKVLLTHGHVDHAFGAAAFDTVYMSHLDAAVLEAHSDMRMRLDYANQSPVEDGIRITENMFAPKPNVAKMKELKDGDVFDLGGMTIEVHALPGHTRGSMTMLFREARILLTGDACNPGTFLFFQGSPSVEEYRENLVAYREKMRGKYDKIILSHGKEVLDSGLLDTVIETCDLVLAGKDDAVPSNFMGEEAYEAAKTVMTERGFGRLDGKVGNILYRRDNIFKK